MRLVLIRHGEANAGVDRVIGGPKGCTGLTDRGRAQAAALRDRLARTGEVQPDACYVSTLPRAVETAEIVMPGAVFVRGDAYCEMVPGVCDGLSHEEAIRLYAPEIDGPDVPLSPGGETGREFHARVAGAVDVLAAGHEGREVVVVTHGGFVMQTCLHVMGDVQLDYVANTSLTIFQRLADGGWRLERFNDHAHLHP